MYAETPRLLIRDPVPEDWRGVYSFLSDAEVMRWIHLGPLPYTEAQCQRWIADLIDYNGEVPRQSHNCVIVNRATDRVIGWIGVGKPSPWRENVGDLDFGYALARDQWGKGYMTEVVGALLAFAFTELDAQRVFAVCEVVNPGSARVMEKNGMTRDDRFFDTEPGLTAPKEMFLYTISKDRWLARQQA